MVPTSLPMELQEHIIDQHSSNKAMLAACSFVCKHWRLRSHHHAFVTIQLTRASVNLFHEFLDTPFSRSAILPQVRRICLVPDDLPWELSRLDHLHQLLSCLLSLGKVETLALRAFQWLTSGAEALGLVISSFSDRITSLELSAVFFSTPAELTDFLCAFPLLQSVTFQDTSRPKDSQSEVALPIVSLPSCGSYSLCIRVLKDCQRRTIHWTRDESLHPSYQFALKDFGAQMSRRKTDLSTLLKVLGPSLQQLELSSHRALKPIQIPHHLTQRSCRHHL